MKRKTYARTEFFSVWTRFRHGRPIFAVTHNTAPHANDVVGYGCHSQDIRTIDRHPLASVGSFQPSRIVNIGVALRGHSEWAARCNRPTEIDGDWPGQRHTALLTRRYQPCGDDLAVVEL